MKKVILIAGLLFFLSCNKHKGKTCSGFFATIYGLGSGGTPSCPSTLFYLDGNSGQEIGGDPSFSIGCDYGTGVYDNVHNYYYVFATEPSNSQNPNRLGLYAYNFATKSGQFLGSSIIDTMSWHWTYTTVICNSTTGKLYSLSPGYLKIDSVNRIYEVVPNPFSVRQIFVTDTQIKMSSPVIDESSGLIYFFSKPDLIKLDPTSGTSAIVTTYTDILPDQLQYNKNDGMFYGFDVHTSPYTFIRIDPKSGSLKKISETNNSVFLTYDICRNVYVMWGSGKYCWVDPSNGSIIKQVHAAFGGTYINSTEQ